MEQMTENLTKARNSITEAEVMEESKDIWEQEAEKKPYINNWDKPKNMPKMEQKEKFTFNPTANYQWKAENVFQITGKELEIIHSAMHTLFETNLPDAKKHVFLSEIYKISSNIIKEAVEQGKILEQPKEEKKGPQPASSQEVFER